VLNNDPRLADPTLLLLAGKMAVARRAQAEAEPEWLHTQGLASLLEAATRADRVIELQIEYAGTADEPPLKGEVYYYYRTNRPYTDSLTKLLQEARAYDEQRRREQAP
jgi:hypothetical protein